MDFTHPRDGFQYDFQGVKSNSVPNSLDKTKFPYAQNIRSLQGGTIRVRPGQVLKFSTGGQANTDLRAYSALSTDNLPRYLARDINDKIWLDNSAQVGSLAAGGLGATLIPFRPNQSPTPWLYIANGADFQKFSSPVGNVVTQRKVGIAEPQAAPDACPDTVNVFKLVNSDAAGSYTQAGVAGVPSNVARGSADTATAFFQDPAAVPPIISTRYSMQVGTNQYQVGEIIVINSLLGGSFSFTVDDVFPAIATQSTISILSIVYYSGSSGRCVIVPSQMPISGLVRSSEGNPTGIPTNSPDLISSLRRGSLITLNTGGGNQETVFVLSVTQGPTGIIAIETTTVNTHAATEPIVGQNALSVTTSLATSQFLGQAISSNAVQSIISGAGNGTLTLPISSPNNPFTHQGIPAFAFLPTPQQDDYVHISFNISDLTKITDVQIQFDIGDGSFTQNYLYFDIQPSALQQAVSFAQTQLAASQTAAQQATIRQELTRADTGIPVRVPLPNLGDQLVSSQVPDTGNIIPSGTSALGSSQWSEIRFSIASLTRVGADETKTLVNTNACRVVINATAAMTLQFGSIWVGAGGQPDIGDIGALYQYRIRPRDSRTGVIGNPSPETRYGIIARRQQVIVSMPSAVYDAQIDTWDIFRFGGAVTSYRYIGSVPSTAATFTDTVFDDAAQAGDSLDFDNFEPWPSVDLPQNLTASKVNGTLALVTIPSPTSALNWLPGTQVQIAGNNVYTLRLRPVFVSGTTYRLEFEECSAPGTNLSVSIPEPTLGNQKQPYMFGMDAQGRAIGVGDPLRPGTYSYCKSNNLDSVPDTYNRELTPASEPLMGGEIIDGLAHLASTERWWQLYPQNDPNPTNFYNPVPLALPRGLAAPLGHCNDGVNIYWWAKDGIYSSNKGSLTDADLYNLFPHEGALGQQVVYAGFTINPPDYSRAGTFRLAHSNGFLYAIYQDSTATYRFLTLDLHRMAWVPDVYTPAVCAVYHPEQQAGTLLTSTARYDETLMTTVDGRVATQTDNANDLGGPIACVAASFEWDGGDVRAPCQWGDFFVDLTPAAFNGVTFQPVSNLAVIGTPQTIASATIRQRSPVSVGGLLVSDFLGLLATWTEDFTRQSVATLLNLWQPSFDIQPAYTIAWQTLGSSYGISGFGHIPWIEIAYISTAAITLTITTVDGMSPAPITLPSSGGAYTKILVRPTFNKGRLYAFAASSTARFQIFEDDTVIQWAPWGRTGNYQAMKNLGAPNVSQGPI